MRQLHTPMMAEEETEEMVVMEGTVAMVEMEVATARVIPVLMLALMLATPREIVIQTAVVIRIAAIVQTVATVQIAVVTDLLPAQVIVIVVVVIAVLEQAQIMVVEIAAFTLLSMHTARMDH